MCDRHVTSSELFISLFCPSCSTNAPWHSEHRIYPLGIPQDAYTSLAAVKMSYRAKDSRPSAASSSQASYLSASSTATTSSFSNFFSSIAKSVTGQSKAFPQPAALVKKAPLTGLDPAKEPIKSYLRFRPRPNDPNKAAAAPYI